MALELVCQQRIVNLAQTVSNHEYIIFIIVSIVSANRLFKSNTHKITGNYVSDYVIF